MLDDQTRAHAQQLLADEILRRLDFGTGTHPCQFPKHSAGMFGCNPAEPGEYVVEFVHGVHRSGPCTPTSAIACRSKVIELRGQGETAAHCPKCKISGRLADFVRIVTLADWLKK